jgi:ribosomal protein S11
MQASFEAEARGKAEALKSKKKLEADINELEVALDGANRGRAEAEKNIKKLQQAVKDVQQVGLKATLIAVSINITSASYY